MPAIPTLTVHRGRRRLARRPQEEALLCCLIAGAISLLLLSLRPGNAGDYVYAALFLTCTSAVLKLRWLVGTVALAAPVLVAADTNLRVRLPPGGAAAACAAAGVDGACVAAAAPTVASLGFAEFVAAGPLPVEALVHILVAWAVGALMAYVSGERRNRRAGPLCKPPPPPLLPGPWVLPRRCHVEKCIHAPPLPCPCPAPQTATAATRLWRTSWR